MRINIANRLMQGLFYPAALGAGIVPLLYKILGKQTPLEAGHRYSQRIRNTPHCLLQSLFPRKRTKGRHLSLGTISRLVGGPSNYPSVKSPWPIRSVRGICPMALTLYLPRDYAYPPLDMEPSGRVLQMAAKAILIVRELIALCGLAFGDFVGWYNIFALAVLILLTVWYIFIIFPDKHMRPNTGPTGQRLRC